MESSTKRKTKGGFTLVELLTVIVIIGILAGLAVPAIFSAISTARRATIQMEITQIGMAIEKYKTEHGDYPPDFAGTSNGGATGDDNDATSLKLQAQAAVVRHFRKAFPHYTPGAYISPTADAPLPTYKGRFDGIQYDIQTALRLAAGQGADTSVNEQYELTPATAMLLMLGGPPAPKDSATKLLGFSANPANPFAIGGSRLTPLYEFDETRIIIPVPAGESAYDGDVPNYMPVYIPPHMPQPATGTKAPYVYFRPRNSNYLNTLSTGNMELPYFFQSQEQGICTPYAEVVTIENNVLTGITRWAEPKKFQIICAGLDGLFGELAVDPATQPADVAPDQVRYLDTNRGNLAPEEDDNLTNFIQGQLIDRPEK